MTREHLVEDIQNVLELVSRAAEEPERQEEARNALRNLHWHIQNEEEVPGTVEGCLQEAVSSVNRAGNGTDARVWNSARACLETALDFARGD